MATVAKEAQRIAPPVALWLKQALSTLRHQVLHISRGESGVRNQGHRSTIHADIGDEKALLSGIL